MCGVDLAWFPAAKYCCRYEILQVYLIGKLIHESDQVSVRGVYDFLWFRHANTAEANYTSAADSAPNELNLGGLDSSSLKTFARRNLQVGFSFSPSSSHMNSNDASLITSFCVLTRENCAPWQCVLQSHGNCTSEKALDCCEGDRRLFSSLARALFAPSCKWRLLPKIATLCQSRTFLCEINWRGLLGSLKLKIF